MVKFIVLLIFIFLSLGIYTRLQKFGAPLSAILYAGCIPISALLFNLILGFKYVIEDDEIKGISKMFYWIVFQIMAFRKLNLVITLFIVKLGRLKVGFLDLFKFNINMYLDAFNKIWRYVEQQVESVFNLSYEEMVLRRG